MLANIQSPMMALSSRKRANNNYTQCTHLPKVVSISDFIRHKSHHWVESNFAIGLVFGRWKGHHPILICRIILEENTVDYQNVAGCISIMCSLQCHIKSYFSIAQGYFFVYASVLGMVIKCVSCKGHGLKSIGF